MTKGFLRPKPIDCMLIMLLFFNFFRLFDAVVLLADLFPENMAARGFIFEVSYAFGLGGITLYLIGIAQTISQSQSARGWLPPPIIVDIFGTLALVFPFICTLPITLAGGARATSNLREAEALIVTANATWFVSAFSIGVAILYAGLRLVRILKNHHRKVGQARNQDDVKVGILKIQLIAAAFVLCLWVYSMILMAYVVRRKTIIRNSVGSIIMSVPWVLLGGLTSIVPQLLLIVNPKTVRNAALRSRSSGGTRDDTNNSTHPDNRFNSTLDGGVTSIGFQSESEFEIESKRQVSFVKTPPESLQIAPASRIERWFQYQTTVPKSESEIILKPVD
ncbi:hypothetical protein BJV82DRAFT_286280 [Fennellomyces sp. T-0311]|nr:hypothetical protein BJV82DRAFT_286280 [Fennellomyces sp. T-0311]